jgi:hypothetical protein
MSRKAEKSLWENVMASSIEIKQFGNVQVDQNIMMMK